MNVGDNAVSEGDVDAGDVVEERRGRVAVANGRAFLDILLPQRQPPQARTKPPKPCGRDCSNGACAL